MNIGSKFILEYRVNTQFISHCILYRTDIIDPENVEVKCIVIAPPPVYHSTKLMDQFKKHIHIFINQNDVVPRLSLYTLAKFYEAATIIDQLNLVGKDFSIPGWQISKIKQTKNFVITIKLRVVDCLGQQHIFTFSDCLLSGVLMLLYCDIWTKWSIIVQQSDLLLATLQYSKALLLSYPYKC